MKKNDMVKIRLKCYIKNKLIYTIDLKMRIGNLEKQIKDNKLEYTSEHTGGTEIIYLDKFDRIVFDKDIELLSMLEGK